MMLLPFLLFSYAGHPEASPASSVISRTQSKDPEEAHPASESRTFSQRILPRASSSNQELHELLSHPLRRLPHPGFISTLKTLINKGESPLPRIGR
jgi:hypothetical protein